jgi:predicted kinase
VPGATPIVIVTGPPAGGKTTIASALASELALPLLAKDAFKELLYDALGSGDVEWSRRLGRAVYPLLYHALEVELRAGRSCVLEANFDHDFAGRELAALSERHPFRALQLVCSAEPDVLLERYAARAGTRHPGHLDAARVDEVREAIAAGRWRALDLGADTIEVDTTDWAAVDVRRLVERARRWLAT